MSERQAVVEFLRLVFATSKNKHSFEEGTVKQSRTLQRVIRDDVSFRRMRRLMQNGQPVPNRLRERVERAARKLVKLAGMRSRRRQKTQAAPTQEETESEQLVMPVTFLSVTKGLESASDSNVCNDDDTGSVQKQRVRLDNILNELEQQKEAQELEREKQHHERKAQWRKLRKEARRRLRKLRKIREREQRRRQRTEERLGLEKLQQRQQLEQLQERVDKAKQANSYSEGLAFRTSVDTTADNEKKPVTCNTSIDEVSSAEEKCTPDDTSHMDFNDSASKRSEDSDTALTMSWADLAFSDGMDSSWYDIDSDELSDMDTETDNDSDNVDDSEDEEGMVSGIVSTIMDLLARASIGNSPNAGRRTDSNSLSLPSAYQSEGDTGFESTGCLTDDSWTNLESLPASARAQETFA
ncbi:MAG: hypothetical protein MHM6MM_002884 [Cercozoa sp. M6MM]